MQLINLFIFLAQTELQESTEALKTKMSELRLYCDLLLQQVNKIKEDSQTEEPGAVVQVSIQQRSQPG